MTDDKKLELWLPELPDKTMPLKFKGQPAARWREFMQRAADRIVKKSGFKKGDWAVQIARDLVKAGDGGAFLAAARRGRGTQRQNLRYQILREVERLMGDQVPRRRPDANTPDSLALKQATVLKLENLP